MKVHYAKTNVRFEQTTRTSPLLRHQKIGGLKHLKDMKKYAYSNKKAEYSRFQNEQICFERFSIHRKRSKITSCSPKIKKNIS